MSVLEVPQPAFMNDPEIQMFSDSAARFFEREAPPERVAGWRKAGQVEREFWSQAGQAGILGVSVPADYGGLGGDFRHDIVLVEQTIRKGVDGFAISLHNVIVTPYIQAHGTEEQKRRWLPKLVNGERVAAIAMSEPGAGSDLQSIRTTAKRVTATATASTAARHSSRTDRSRISSSSSLKPIPPRGTKAYR
jgi:alkylation response protein AidB-like acyl-CoA dehydrogenase